MEVYDNICDDRAGALFIDEDFEMNYMMMKVNEVVAMYDYDGLTIMEIVEKTGMTADEVVDVLNEFAETFT
jgi:hypothetical protein